MTGATPCKSALLPVTGTGALRPAPSSERATIAVMDSATNVTRSTPSERVKRRCKATNAMGQPCRSPTVGGDGYCSAHRDGGARMVELGRLGGKASVKAKQDKERHARDRLRRHVDRHFDKVWAAFEAGLDSADPSVRFRAASQLLSQAYGSPAASVVEEAEPAVFILESAFPKPDDS